MWNFDNIDYSLAAQAILDDLAIRVSTRVISQGVGRQNIQLQAFRGVRREVFESLTQRCANPSAKQAKEVEEFAESRSSRKIKKVNYKEPSTTEFDARRSETLTKVCVAGSTAQWNLIRLDRANTSCGFLGKPTGSKGSWGINNIQDSNQVEKC